jgi:hypothetical protein
MAITGAGREVSPADLPPADRYRFSSPGRIGKPIGSMRRFLKKVGLGPAGGGLGAQGRKPARCRADPRDLLADKGLPAWWTVSADRGLRQSLVFRGGRFMIKTTRGDQPA